MENLAHTLTGACLASAGFQARVGRKTALAVGIVAANLPDVDLVTSFVAGPDYYMDWHRGITHSLAALAVAPPLLAAAIARATGKTSFRPLWLLATLAYASHIVLDWVTSWGTMVLLPWSDRRFAAHWLFIVDPWLWVVLTLPAWLGIVLRRRTTVLSRIAIGLLTGYVGGNGLLHHMAVTRVRDAAARQGIAARYVQAYPTPFSPARWHGVVVDGGYLHMASIDLRRDGATVLDRLQPRNLGEPAVDAVARTLRGRRFLDWWADTPYATATWNGNSCEVSLADMRYNDPLVARPGFELVFHVARDAAGGLTVDTPAWRTAWSGGR